MKLSDLAVKHPYYCSDSNYFSNEPNQAFPTVAEFLDEFGDADVDLNLCFRFDVLADEDDDGKPNGTHRAEVFLMLQRKGIFKPISIEVVTEADVPSLLAYLQKHWATMQAIWQPLAAPSCPDQAGAPGEEK